MIYFPLIFIAVGFKFGLLFHFDHIFSDLCIIFLANFFRGLLILS